MYNPDPNSDMSRGAPRTVHPDPATPEQHAAKWDEINAWRAAQLAKGGKVIGGIWVYPEAPVKAAKAPRKARKPRKPAARKPATVPSYAYHV